MRRTPLRRSSPDKIREWQRRSKSLSGKRRSPAKTARTEAEARTYADLRRAAQRRADDRCEAEYLHAPTCTGKGTEAHHIVPRKLDGPDALFNLMWVNSDCHLGQIHGKPDHAVPLGYLKRGVDWDTTNDRRPWE